MLQSVECTDINGALLSMERITGQQSICIRWQPETRHCVRSVRVSL